LATISSGLWRFLPISKILLNGSKAILHGGSLFRGQTILANPNGKRLRAYWQGQTPADTASSTYVRLPASSWGRFPTDAASLKEIPPLPPMASNSNSSPDPNTLMRVHHYIRDTMFLDASLNIEGDN
jgi:hypothetical protein